MMDDSEFRRFCELADMDRHLAIATRITVALLVCAVLISAVLAHAIGA